MDEQYRKYYDILGLPYGSGTETIKKKFREKAMLLHPDRNPSADAHQKFIELLEAYEILTKIKSAGFKRRKRYSAADIEEIRRQACRKARMEYEAFIKQHEAFRQTFFSRLVSVFNFLGLLLCIVSLIDAFLPNTKVETTVLQKIWTEENLFLIKTPVVQFEAEPDFFKHVKTGDTLILQTSRLMNIPVAFSLHKTDDKISSKPPEGFFTLLPFFVVLLLLPLVPWLHKKKTYERVYWAEYFRFAGIAALIAFLTLIIKSSLWF